MSIYRTTEARNPTLDSFSVIGVHQDPAVQVGGGKFDFSGKHAIIVRTALGPRFFFFGRCVPYERIFLL